MTHDPLPYIVRLRRTVGEDCLPMVSEHRVTAYSVMEAVFQAIFTSGGEVSTDHADVRVEEVAPDVPAYFVALVENDMKRKMLGVEKRTK